MESFDLKSEVASIKDDLLKRIKGTFPVAFVAVWLIRYWDIVLVIINRDLLINEKRYYINHWLYHQGGTLAVIGKTIFFAFVGIIIFHVATLLTKWINGYVKLNIKPIVAKQIPNYKLVDYEDYEKEIKKSRHLENKNQELREKLSNQNLLVETLAKQIEDSKSNQASTTHPMLSEIFKGTYKNSYKGITNDRVSNEVFYVVNNIYIIDKNNKEEHDIYGVELNENNRLYFIKYSRNRKYMCVNILNRQKESDKWIGTEFTLLTQGGDNFTLESIIGNPNQSFRKYFVYDIFHVTYEPLK